MFTKCRREIPPLQGWEDVNIHYVEIVHHTFDYDTENMEDAIAQFENDMNNGNLDFSDGEVMNSSYDVSEGEWIDTEVIVRDMYQFFA